MIKAEWTNADALNLQPTCNQLATDCISRQAAIKAIEDLQDCYNGFSDSYDKACIIGVLEEVPSAQPDIARDIATIIENEQDMRVIAQNAQPERLVRAVAGKSPEEIYDFLCWLMFVYAKAFTDSRAAVSAWLEGEQE